MEASSFLEMLKRAGVAASVEPTDDGLRLTFPLAAPPAECDAPAADGASQAETPRSVPSMPPIHSGLYPSAGPLSLVWRSSVSELAVDAVKAWLAARREVEHWRYLAGHDSLSGLPNRRGWEERLSTAGTGPLGIAVLDLDHFKDWNTHGGHLAGDELLRTFARHLRQAAGPDELVARLGGDEFSFVTFAGDYDAFSRRLDELRAGWKAVPARRELGGRLLDPSAVSIGAAWREANQPALDWQQVYRDADAGLRESKLSGRNRVTISRVAAESGDG